MTYFSDFDFHPNYDDPTTRDRILRDAEEEYLEDTPESVPWDLLEDFQRRYTNGVIERHRDSNLVKSSDFNMHFAIPKQ